MPEPQQRTDPEFLQWLEETYGIEKVLQGFATGGQKQIVAAYTDPNGPYYQYWSTAVKSQGQKPAGGKKGGTEPFVPDEFGQAEQDFLAMLWNWLQEQKALGALTDELVNYSYREAVQDLRGGLGVSRQSANLIDVPASQRVSASKNKQVVGGQTVYTWQEQKEPKTIPQLRLFDKVTGWATAKNEAYQKALASYEAGQVEDETKRKWEEEQGKYEGYLASVEQAQEEATRKEDIYARALPSYVGAEGAVPKGVEKPGQAPPKTATAEEILTKATETLPRAVREYARRSGIAEDEFERAFPGARAAWQAALVPEPEQMTAEESAAYWQRELTATDERAAFLANLYPELVMRPGQTQTMYDEFSGTFVPVEGPAQRVTQQPSDLTTAQQLAWGGIQAPQGAEKMLGQAEARLMKERAEFQPMTSGFIPAPRKLRDPWEKYLQDYPFMQKWLEQPRYQRGLAPRYQTPKVRWRV